MSTITTRAGKGSALTHNELDANFKKAAQAKTGAYTVAASDNRDTIECSGTFTVTMPDVATVVAAADTGDFEVTIKNTGTGRITVSCTTGTDTIEGSTSDYTIEENDSFVFKTNQAGNGYNIDKSHIVTGSKVFASMSNASQLFTSGATTTIIFDTETLDASGEYDNTTGVFTATKAGYYLISTDVYGDKQISTPASGDTAFATLKKNTTVISRSYVLFDGTLTEAALHCSAVIDLAIGDTLKVDFLINLATGSGLIQGPSGGGGISTLSITSL